MPMIRVDETVAEAVRKLQAWLSEVNAIGGRPMPISATNAIYWLFAQASIHLPLKELPDDMSWWPQGVGVADRLSRRKLK